MPGSDLKTQSGIQSELISFLLFSLGLPQVDTFDRCFFNPVDCGFLKFSFQTEFNWARLFLELLEKLK